MPLTERIPEGLGDVIVRRLSRLTLETNRLLSTAAVIGRDFDLETLRRVVDLSEEELLTGIDSQVEDAILDSSLDLIRLIAPTTRPERASAIADQGQGFLYYIARTGVTGASESLAEDLEEDVSCLPFYR